MYCSSFHKTENVINKFKLSSLLLTQTISIKILFIANVDETKLQNYTHHKERSVENCEKKLRTLLQVKSTSNLLQFVKLEL